MKRFPIELGINKICGCCGACTNIPLSKLECRPVCERCGDALEITDADKVAAGAMLAHAAATGENVMIQ